MKTPEFVWYKFIISMQKCSRFDWLMRSEYCFKLFLIEDAKQNSRLEVFCKAGILKNIPKFTEKHLCQSLSFNKVDQPFSQNSLFQFDFLKLGMATKQVLMLPPRLTSSNQ